MIEIVTSENRHIYYSLIEDMYRMRYDVVVKKWGWKVAGATVGRDKDQFDTDDTVYILHLDPTRTIVTGCCRLNKTTGPNMLSELYADACDLQGVPSSNTIWEASRFVVSADLRSRQQYYDVMWRIGVGVNEYGLSAGIEQIAWYTGPSFYNTINRVMEIEPLGRPRFHEGDQETYIPALSTVNEASLIAMRERLSDPHERITFALAPIYQISPKTQTIPQEAA